MSYLDNKGVERLWAHITAKLGDKVTKEEGKGLSSNDFTTAEKTKLANLTTPSITSTGAGNAVTNIGDKINALHTHIDKAIEDAPTKLKVTVTLCDVDWQKIQDLLRKQREWLINQSQTTVQSVNAMLVEERKKAMNRYKEYDGCYLGHYAQWFFWLFFTIGFSVVAGGIAMLIAQQYGP